MLNCKFQRFFISFLFLFFTLQLWGQQVVSQSAGIHQLILKNGDKYTGILVLKNEEIVMLRTKDGTRYQFPVAEIESLVRLEHQSNDRPIDPADKKLYTHYNSISTPNYCVMVDGGGGVSHTQGSFGWSNHSQLDLLLGATNLLAKNLFVGLGVGHTTIFEADQGSTRTFLPLFVRVQTTLTNRSTAPFIGLDAGYGFSLNSVYEGGVTYKLWGGIAHKMNSKSIFFAGLYVGMQSFTGTLTETVNSVNYTYVGYKSANLLGAKVGLAF